MEPKYPRRYPRYEGCAREPYRDPSPELDAAITVFIVCALGYFAWPVVGHLFAAASAWLGGAR